MAPLSNSFRFAASLPAIALLLFGTSAQAVSHKRDSPPAISLSASSIRFASISAGSVSPAQTIRLTNTGTAELDLSGIALTGNGANLFTQTNTCGVAVAAGSSCSISATFNPLVAGSYSAALSVIDNAEDSVQTIALTGAATPATIT